MSEVLEYYKKIGAQRREAITEGNNKRLRYLLGVELGIIMTTKLLTGKEIWELEQ